MRDCSSAGDAVDVSMRSCTSSARVAQSLAFSCADTYMAPSSVSQKHSAYLGELFSRSGVKTLHNGKSCIAPRQLVISMNVLRKTISMGQISSKECDKYVYAKQLRTYRKWDLRVYFLFAPKQLMDTAIFKEHTQILYVSFCDVYILEATALNDE